MAVLKYKDENGKFVEIVGLVGPRGQKGEKGDKGDTASGIKDIIATALGKLTILQADNSQHDVELITSNSFFGTFLSSGWSDVAPFTQTITVNGLFATDNPIIDVNMENVTDSEGVLEQYSCIGRVTISADNTATAYCYTEKPEVDMPIIFKVIR